MRLPLAVFVCVLGSVCAQALGALPALAQDATRDPLLTSGVSCGTTVEPPRGQVEVLSRPQVAGPRRYVSYALLLLGLLAGFLAYDSVAREGASRRSRFGRSLLGLFALAALLALLLPALPVHDHNVFVARAECAMDPDCDVDRPGWMPPAYHGMGLLLSALPYRYPLVEYTGLALSLLALALFTLSLVRLHRLFGAASRGQHVALLACVFLALNPIWLRLAVAGTFWPWADACLAAAIWFALFAVEHRRASAWLASAAFFALALTSNVTFLALAPLALLAPWAWARRPSRPSALLPLALVALFTGPYAWASVQRLGGAAASMPWSEALLRVPLNLVFLDPRLTPLPLGLLFLLGFVVAMRRPRRTLPLLFAFAATETLLGSLQTLETGYPVRLIHGTTSLYFSAWLAAEGAVAVGAWLRRHSISSRHALAGLVALTLLSAPLCREARAFAWGPRVLGPERRALSHALDRLPEHDVLVVPPSIMRPLGGLSWDGDPLEARYPWGEYRAVRLAHAQSFATIIPLPDFLQHREEYRDSRVLFYVGANLRSFAPAEVAAGFARSPFARPLLCDVLARFQLEPAATFTLPTANHPASLLRLTGDVRPTATLGFFWLRSRAGARP